jgi:sugar/nucleoside kinase (ribokinase family)
MSQLSRKEFDFVIAGHLCVDIYPDLSKYTSNDFLQRLNPGKLVYVGDAKFSTGGLVSNTGVALHKLGADVSLMGKIGDDALGSTITEILNKYGDNLAGNLIHAKNEGSSYTIILNPPAVDRIFLHFPGTNDTFLADDIDFESVKNAKIFHFGYPPLMRKMHEDQGDNLVEVMRRSKNSGVITSLDMALPDPKSDAGRAGWMEIIQKTLPYVDIFLPSFEEILYMLDRPLFTELMKKAHHGDIIPFIKSHYLHKLSDELLDMGARIVGIKLGNRGFYVRTSKQKSIDEIARLVPIKNDEWADVEIWSPCFEVQPKGTTGSGDSTVAGFLLSMLKGLNIEQAVQMAVAVGACSVETLDSATGIRSWEETRARIQNGWRKNSLQIELENWVHNSEYDHWEKQHGS